MPALLDVVEVPITRHRRDPGQPENWEVESGTKWSRIRRESPKNLALLVEQPSDLWLDEGRGRRRDRISVADQLARPSTPSLFLIQPSGFHVEMWTEWNHYRGYDQFKTKAVFTYAGTEYSLSITDDRFTREYCPRGDGSKRTITPPWECFLCASLSMPLNDFHYKLIAAVIPNI